MCKMALGEYIGKVVLVMGFVLFCWWLCGIKICCWNFGTEKLERDIMVILEKMMSLESCVAEQTTRSNWGLVRDPRLRCSDRFSS